MTNDTLTIDDVKTMWETLRQMQQPKYVVLVNANDPLRWEYERLGYETMVFESNILPVEEGQCYAIDKSKIPHINIPAPTKTEAELLEAIKNEFPELWEELQESK